MFYFPLVFKGQIRALEQSPSPVTANKQTVSADNEGVAQDRDGEKIKTIFSPYILFIAHV